MGKKKKMTNMEYDRMKIIESSGVEFDEIVGSGIEFVEHSVIE
jgi:hypothetical protein